jgi:D-alanine-D-alanine ligase
MQNIIEENKTFVAIKKIAILCSAVKREYFNTEAEYITEKDAERDAEVIASYLKNLGFDAYIIPADDDFQQKIKKIKPDMVFNLVGSVRGVDRLAATIPSILEFLGIPFTGAGIFCETLSYNKFLTAELLKSVSVVVPNSQLFSDYKDELSFGLKFPLISKLNEIHGAVNMDKDAISFDEKHLRNRVKFLIETYRQPVLVQEFVAGRELTAIVLEGGDENVFAAEKVFDKDTGDFSFATFDDQWADGNGFHYEKYEDEKLKNLARKAFAISKMHDYAKFDIRLNRAGNYFFIDSNSNPAFGPKELDCAISNVLHLYGVSFNTILERIILNVLKRFSFFRQHTKIS